MLFAVTQDGTRRDGSYPVDCYDYCGANKSCKHETNLPKNSRFLSLKSKFHLPMVNCSHEHFFLRRLLQIGLKQHPFFFLPLTLQLLPFLAEHHPQSLALVVTSDLRPTCWVSSKLSQALQSRLGQREASAEKQEAAQLSPRPQVTETGVLSSLQHVTVTSVSLNVITLL